MVDDDPQDVVTAMQTSVWGGTCLFTASNESSHLMIRIDLMMEVAEEERGNRSF